MRTMRRVDARRAALLFTPLLVAAVAACEPGETLETRTFDLEHLRPAVAEQIVAPYVFTDRAEDPGMMSISADAGAITVRERPENLEEIARVLEARDVARPGVVLNFQVIEAGAGNGATDPALADIEPALREVLRFDEYRLVADAVVRAAEDSEFRQNVAGRSARAIHGTLYGVRPGNGGPATGRLRVSFWLTESNMALETTVNVTDGRTVVLGTAGEREDGSAVILVVRPEFES